MYNYFFQSFVALLSGAETWGGAGPSHPPDRFRGGGRSAPEISK